MISTGIYEIDLNLVFHVNSQPLFRLDNMPPDRIFVKSISFDRFGHCALHEHTPTQFRYDWRAPPPSPLPESLVAYDRYNNRSSTSSVHDLLNIPVALSSIDRVRTTLVELLVTRCMAERGVGRDVRVLENVADRDHIPQSMHQLGLSLVNFAVGPPIPSLPCSTPSGNTCDFVWIRKDVCVHITTHLDDNDNLRATLSIISIQHWIKWAPFMASRALSFTVPSFEWTRMSWVHHSPIHQHYNSCLPSTRGRCLRRVLKLCQG